MGLEMHFPLGSSKTILKTPRKTIRNFGNICYIKSSKPSTSKHLIMGRNALAQKQVSKFQSHIQHLLKTSGVQGLTLVLWLTWGSLHSASTRPFPLNKKQDSEFHSNASLPVRKEVFFKLINSWKCFKPLKGCSQIYRNIYRVSFDPLRRHRTYKF